MLHSAWHCKYATDVQHAAEPPGMQLQLLIGQMGD